MKMFERDGKIFECMICGSLYFEIKSYEVAEDNAVIGFLVKCPDYSGVYDI